MTEIKYVSAISLADAARHIHIALRETFPKVEIHLEAIEGQNDVIRPDDGKRISYPEDPTSIIATYTDGPTRVAVESICKKFGYHRAYWRSDAGMIHREFFPSMVRTQTPIGILCPTFKGTIRVRRFYSPTIRDRYGLAARTPIDKYERSAYHELRRNLDQVDFTDTIYEESFFDVAAEY